MFTYIQSEQKINSAARLHTRQQLARKIVASEFFYGLSTGNKNWSATSWPAR